MGTVWRLSEFDKFGYLKYGRNSIAAPELHVMNVSLTPELECLVNEKVQSGMYQTASEVVREALRLLKEHDEVKLRQLREAIRVGIDQLERGEYIEYGGTDLKALAAAVKDRGRRRLAGTRKTSAR
jgi:antitoxin ParD1/3/4